MSKYIGNTVQYKNNQNNKTFSEKSTRIKTRSISTASCSSTPPTSPCSSCSSSCSTSSLSANVSSDKRKRKSTAINKDQNGPYFIPLINHNPTINVKSPLRVEPYPEPFRQIQLTPCDHLPTNNSNQIDISTGNHLDDGQVLLSKTVLAEVHPEPAPSSSKPLKSQTKSSLSKSNSSTTTSSSSSSSSSSKSVLPSRSIVVDSLPNFSPLIKNNYNLKGNNSRESKMTIYSILSNSNQNKLNQITINGSLPNGLTKKIFPSVTNQQSTVTLETTNLSEVRLNMETIKEKKSNQSTNDNQLINDNDQDNQPSDNKDEIMSTEGENQLNRDASETNVTITDSMKVNCSTDSINNDDGKTVNPIEINKNQTEKIKSLLKTVSSDKKIALERRLSGSFPSSDTPDTNESSAPSPGWATRILNPELKFQNTNTNRPMLNHSQKYPTISSSRAPSIISGYSVYDVQVPHEKLTDLRKILNPEVEKKDLETVFKAHWETFMDCRCFECTFNNAAKFITVIVLAITFFLFTRALTNIVRR